MQYKTNILILLIVFVLISHGCSKKDDSTDRLSTDSFTTLAIEPTFNLVESDDFAFRFIRSMQIDNRGNILVNDPSQPMVFMFNAEGSFIQQIGKKGRGPGEFQQVGSVLAARDSLAVIDGRSHKIEIFRYHDGKYEYIRTIDVENQKHLGNLLGLTERGILVENNIWLSPLSTNNPTETAISLLGHDGSVLQDSLFSVPLHEFVLHKSETPFVRGKIYGNSSQLAFDESEGKVYSLWTEEMSINYYTLSGKEHEAFSYPLKPIRVTETERDSVLNRLDETTRSVMSNHIADVKPVAGDLVVDDQQRLWVELLSEELDHGWFAFSPEGEPLFRINIPHHKARLHDIRGNSFLWSYTDEKGVPHIVKSKVEYP